MVWLKDLCNEALRACTWPATTVCVANGDRTVGSKHWHVCAAVSLVVSCCAVEEATPAMVVVSEELSDWNCEETSDCVAYTLGSKHWQAGAMVSFVASCCDSDVMVVFVKDCTVFRFRTCAFTFEIADCNGFGEGEESISVTTGANKVLLVCTMLITLLSTRDSIDVLKAIS